MGHLLELVRQPETLLKKLRDGDVRTISGILSLVENREEGWREVMEAVYPSSRDAIRIGITGPPGAGKSTLTGRLVGEFRREGISVGVVAVDPTSPFTGGAILGDRLRIWRHAGDPGVFVRSMGSRGKSGGLSWASSHVSDILASTGKEVILVETVGAGQGDIDVVDQVDLTVVVLVPESGDDVQLLKAGQVEAGDVFVINKADREGADRLGRALEEQLTISGRFPDGPTVRQTVATEGRGTRAAFDSVRHEWAKLSSSGRLAVRRQDQYARSVRRIVREEIERDLWDRWNDSTATDELGAAFTERRSPWAVADQIIERARRVGQ